MIASRQMVAAARRAMVARSDWNDAQIELQAEGLNERLREQALSRKREQFHAANDFLALIVCQELAIDAFGHELATLTRATPAPARVVKLCAVRVTEGLGVGPPRSAPAPEPAVSTALALVQARVAESREAYRSTNDMDVQAASRARATYIAALIEYFDVREQEDCQRLMAAE